jgi:hypothetical protein
MYADAQIHVAVVGLQFFFFSRAGFASEGLSKGSLMEVCFIPPVQM